MTGREDRHIESESTATEQRNPGRGGMLHSGTYSQAKKGPRRASLAFLRPGPFGAFLACESAVVDLIEPSCTNDFKSPVFDLSPFVAFGRQRLPLTRF